MEVEQKEATTAHVLTGFIVLAVHQSRTRRPESERSSGNRNRTPLGVVGVHGHTRRRGATRHSHECQWPSPRVARVCGARRLARVLLGAAQAGRDQILSSTRQATRHPAGHSDAERPAHANPGMMSPLWLQPDLGSSSLVAVARRGDSTCRMSCQPAPYRRAG